MYNLPLSSLSLSPTKRPTTRPDHRARLTYLAYYRRPPVRNLRYLLDFFRPSFLPSPFPSHSLPQRRRDDDDDDVDDDEILS